MAKHKKMHATASDNFVLKALHQAVATSLVTALLLNTALAGPIGGQVVAGSANIAGQGTAAVNITQSSQNVVINWNNFDTGANESVTFHQPNTNAVALNRVLSGSPTQFNGQLKANGNVIVMNGNGVVFGSSAKVDVGGLLATTADIDTDDFMNGGIFDFKHTGNPNAAIVNNGTISARDGGLVGFVAPNVENNGIIQVKLGKVQMAAGDSFTYDFYGDGLVEVKASDAINAQLVKNNGTIKADGGTILMSAAQAKDIVNGLVVNTGVLEAKTVEDKNGVIILSGGDTNDVIQNGTLNASGTHGGTIDVKGRNILVGGAIKATGSSTKGGTAKILAKDKLETSAGASIDVSGAEGGAIIQNAKGSISSGTYKAVGTQGKGGTIDWGGNVSLLSAKLDASGKTEGGRIRLGGIWQNPSSQGWDAYDQHLDASTNIFVSTGSELKAKATGNDGKGGEIVLRAQDKNYFAGSLDATPGINSGNGGRAEISGGQINLVDGNAIKTGLSGRNGELLLDPKNITITAASADALQTAKFGFAYALTNSYYFGQSIAMNAAGDLMAVGAIGDNTGGTERGAVYLFDIDTANLSASPVLLQKITSGTSGISVTDGSHLGRSVAFNADGSLLAIGAFRDSSTGYQQGSVFLLGMNTSNFTLAPTLYKKLTNGVDGITLANEDYFGSSLSLNATGSVIAIGSERYDASGLTDNGAIYLYSLDTSNFANPVTFRQRITHGTPGLTLGSYNYFGTGVSLNAAGDILAVGTYSNAAYLFNLNPADLTQSAVLRKKIENGVGGLTLSGSDGFGFDVELNAAGDILVSASIGDDMGASDAGAAYVFRLNTADLTTNPVILKKIGNGTSGMSLAAGDQFGVGIALNADASILAVSARLEDNGGVFDAGTVRLFDLSPLTLTSGLSYGQNAAGSTTLSASLISQLLAAGNNLTLQANNDITVNSAILVNNASGNGANLTLQAGRSVVFNANVTTDNGNLTVIANDILANGVVDAYRDAGNAAITMGSGTTLNAGTGSVQLLMRDGAGKTNTGSGDVTLYGVTAGNLLVEGQQNLVLNGAISVSGAGTAILRANQNITVNGTGSVTTQGGEIVLNSDRDGVNGGGIGTATGALIKSNGGNITFAGGASANTYAVGTSLTQPSGVYLVGATVDATGVSTGGTITMIGRGWANSTSDVNSGVSRPAGVTVSESTIQTNNNGAITITGLGDGQAGSAGMGVFVRNNSRITVAKGDITITGTGGGTGAGNYREGFVFSQNGTNIIEATDSGNINITGTGANFNDSSGIVLNALSSTSGIFSRSGNITLTGITTNASSYAFASNNGTGGTIGGINATGTITLIGDSMSFSPAQYIQTAGEIVIRPYTAGKTIGVGTGGNLTLTNAILSRISAGYRLWIGGYGDAGDAPIGPGYINNAGDIFWNTTAAINNNLVLMTPGTITTSSAINMDGFKSLTLTAGDLSLGGAVNGMGNLFIQPSNANALVSLNSTNLNNPGVFSLDFNEIEYIDDGWNQVTVGRLDSTNDIYIGRSNWGDRTVFRTGGGYTRVTDNVLVTSDVIFASLGTYFDNADIYAASNSNIHFFNDLTFNTGSSTIGAAGNITIDRDVIVNGGSGAISTIYSDNGDVMITRNITESGSTAGKTLNLDAGNGSLIFNGTVNGAFDVTASSQYMGFNGAWGGTTRLGDVSLTSSDTLNLPSITASTIFARVTGAGSSLILDSSTALNANAAGTNITLVTANDFVRTAGSSLATGSGRWLIYLTDPASTTLNGLTSNFNRYTCSYGACSVTIPTSGNGFLYAYTPMLTVTPNGVSVTYGDSVNLNNYGYSISGYLTGDDGTGDITGTINGSTTYAAGSDIGTYNIDYASGNLVSALGYGFTYQNSSNALTVNRRVLTVSLTGSTAKVYDGNTNATLDSTDYTLGNIYGSDDVSISNTVGSYDNQNVGSNKNVTVNGLTLGGTKANNYTLNGVTSTSGTIGEVTPASLTITANDATKTYGNTHTFNGSEFSTSGLISGDNVASVTLNSAGSASTATVAGGPYAIVASNANGTGLSNYTITYVDGSLTVNPAALTITATNATKTYGNTHTFNGTEFTSSGLLNGDNIVSVTLNSSGAAATATVAGGPYAITASNASGTGLSNYTITYVDGSLTVNKANLTVTANNTTKTYGDVVTFDGDEFTSSGLVNGDTVVSVTLNSAGAGATATVAGGPYAIVANNATGSGLDNYNITYNNGSLTVNKASLTVTANNATKTYGNTTTFAGTEFTTSGLLNGDNVASVTLNSAGAVANASVAGGPYAIVASNANGAGLSNYDITYNDGSLTVNKAALNVIANTINKLNGTTYTFNGTEFTTSGLVAGDSVAHVDLTSSGSASGAAEGAYAIYASNAIGSGLANYNITYTDGTMNVSAATVTPPVDPPAATPESKYQQLYDTPANIPSNTKEADAMQQTANDTIEEANNSKSIESKGCLYSMIGYYELGALGSYVCRF